MVSLFNQINRNSLKQSTESTFIMPGFNFRIALDLTSFYEDYRSKCYMYIDVTKLHTIEDLEVHIKKQFKIPDNIYISTDGYYVPANETIEILNTNEILKVCKLEESIPGASGDTGDGKNTKDKAFDYKNKDEKEHKGNFNHTPVVFEENVVNLNCKNGSLKNGRKINNDSGVEVEDETKYFWKKNGTETKKKQDKKAHSVMETKDNGVMEIEDNGITNDSVAKTSSKDKKKKKRKTHAALEEEIDVSSENIFQDETQPRKKRRKRNITLEDSNIEVCTANDQFPVEECEQQCDNNKIDILNNDYISEARITKENCNETIQKLGDENDLEQLQNNDFLSEEGSVSVMDGDKGQKRKRTRRRKKKNKVQGFDPIFPMLNRVKTKAFSIPQQTNFSTTNHIRFTSDDETDNVDENSSSLSANTQNGSCKKPNVPSFSKWDVKPPEKRDNSLSSQKSSALIFDEIMSKTEPAFKYNSTAIIFDCTKTPQYEEPKLEMTKSESVLEIESKQEKTKPLVESKPEDTLNVIATSSPLEGQPRKNDLIAFKMFRLSPEYTPELSKHITARVLHYDADTFTVKLQIIEGCTELSEPKGKFSLEEEDVEPTQSEIVELNWNEMLEPRLIFP